MLLLSGPPGSGLTSHILAEFRQALRRNASNIRLLVPTATMAEHLQHKLAREEFVFRPGLILTLSKFVSSWVEDLPEVSPATLNLIVESIVRRTAPAEFARVLDSPGLCASLTDVIEEFSSAGCDSQRLRGALPDTLFGVPFADVYRELERELARRGVGLRSTRLERAAHRIGRQGLAGVDTVWLDGFFALTDPELEVVRAIGGHADVTITLPNHEGPDPTRAALLRMGFAERRVGGQVGDLLHGRTFSAPSVDREAEEIARRIVAEVGAGASFRDVGVIVRNPDIYLAPLKAALERFWVPARFYFAGALDENGVVKYLDGIVSALPGGWEHEAVLAALRYSGDSCALDEFDFAVRERLPGRGLDGLKALTGDPELLRILNELSTLDSWSSLSLAPPLWFSRLQSLRGLVAQPRPKGSDSRALADMWRTQARALTAFEQALEEAAAFLGEERRISLQEFWTTARTVMRLTTLKVPDRRQNVTHVLSVFEARLWELPIVFICGLAEQQFPKRQTQDPLFPDTALLHLAQSGVRVRTAAEKEREERFLFELSSACATSTLTLSYAEADSRGVRNLPSPFLTRAAERCLQLARPRHAELPSTPFVPFAAVTHRSFSPSGLECFLDCPFQFFGRYTLRLRARPLLPQDRLDFMLQGTIVHQTLAEWHQNPQAIEPLFERIFAEKCAEKRVFLGYRTETLRRQMLDDLRQFAEKLKLPAPADVLTEQRFEISLDDLILRGRIDRIDKLPDGRALIVDYKYSAAQRVAARLKKATLLQGGLYALAVERELGLQPAGVFYYGLKKELKVVGWSDPPGAFGVDSQPLTREWIDAAVAQTRDAVKEIRAGRIAPDPVDADLCRLCEFRDVCRFDVATRAVSAEAS